MRFDRAAVALGLPATALPFWAAWIERNQPAVGSPPLARALRES